MLKTLSKLIGLWSFMYLRIDVFIPSGRAINPITNGNWEGTGVESDIHASAHEALRVAHLRAVREIQASKKDIVPLQISEIQRVIDELEPEDE